MNVIHKTRKKKTEKKNMFLIDEKQSLNAVQCNNAGKPLYKDTLRRFCKKIFKALIKKMRRYKACSANINMYTIYTTPTRFKYHIKRTSGEDHHKFMRY